MDTTVRTLERQVGSDPVVIDALVAAMARAGDRFGLEKLAGDPHAVGQAHGWLSSVSYQAGRAAARALVTIRLAAGETVDVRESSMAGPCFRRGTIVRESAKFYTVTGDELGEATRFLKTKGGIHFAPCARCTDHPRTSYPRGYEG